MPEVPAVSGLAGVTAAVFDRDGALARTLPAFEPREGQAMAWVEPLGLGAYDFPPADRALIERLAARR